MARQRRRTEPVETLHGVLVAYDEIEAFLSAGELSGRRWVLDQALACPSGRTPSDTDILDLHSAMFRSVFAWAGTPRDTERGPGGSVNVRPWEVRAELRKLSDDLPFWISAIGAEPDVAAIAGIVADVHHKFQWIHPFHDTNGRTGRVLDHYLLWVTFGLGKETLEESLSIDYFPTLEHEDTYYNGLCEADNYRPDPLRAFYTERLEALFDAPPMNAPPEQGGA